MELQRSFPMYFAILSTLESKFHARRFSFASFMPHVVCTFWPKESEQRKHTKKNISLLNSTFNFCEQILWMRCERERERNTQKYYSSNFWSQIKTKLEFIRNEESKRKQMRSRTSRRSILSSGFGCSIPTSFFLLSTLHQ